MVTLRDLHHILLLLAPGGFGGGAEADAGGVYRAAGVEGDRVFVDM